MAKKPLKKSTKKTTPAKSKPKKTVAKKTPPKKTASQKAPPKKTPAKPATKKIVKGATRKTPDHPRQEATKIIARKDVGFGNEMFIRGEGGDLGWDTGVHMECTGEGEWTFETTHATGNLIVKFLINDDEWSEGENVVAPAGEATVVVPSF